MAKTTYLIGAGASATCLPVVNQIPSRITECLTVTLPKAKQSFGSIRPYGYNGESISDLIDAFGRDLAWLNKELEDSATIDTLAKTYMIRQEKASLLKLKAVFSIFLLLEQARVKPDARYTLFWASLIRKNFSELADSNRLNILSWNYDSQMEKTLLPLSGLSDINELPKSIQILPTNSANNKLDYSKFSIIKLNGSAGLHRTQKEGLKKIDSYITWPYGEDVFDKILRFYITYISQPGLLVPELNFAWEGDNNAQTLLTEAERACADTEQLIVIGYSCPYFNKEVDMQLLRSMKNLHSIIIQAGADGQAIKERLSIYTSQVTEYKIIQDTGQFYIPLHF